MPSPIALFVYNRLQHTKETISALASNTLASESELYIFSDAAKTPKDQEKVDAIRNFLHNVKGFKKIVIIERTTNYGLSKSIVEGVTQVIDQFGQIIVLEDDMVTNTNFLTYMNRSLIHYADVEKIISIHGYIYPINGLPPLFFLKGADCWGWATWKRGWDLMELDGHKLLTELKNRNLMERFNMHGTYPYDKMLLKQISGKIDSWAIRWYASALIKDKLTLYPGTTYVQNIGLDGSGAHSKDTDTFRTSLTDFEVPDCFPAPEENKLALNKIEQWFKLQNTSCLKRYLVLLSSKIKNLLVR